jgi:hypothetical protein
MMDMSLLRPFAVSSEVAQRSDSIVARAHLVVHQIELLVHEPPCRVVVIDSQFGAGQPLVAGGPVEE